MRKQVLAASPTALKVGDGCLPVPLRSRWSPSRQPVAGAIIAMRSEIDPRLRMADLADGGEVGVPIIVAKPRYFHRWSL